MNMQSESDRYLSFSLGVEEFAIPLLTVREVIAIPEFTPVPHTPSYFLGLINLRGLVISVIDLRAKLNIKPPESSEAAIIICDLKSLCIGIRVDSINAVIAPKPEELSPKPVIDEKHSADHVIAIYKKETSLILLLDIYKALNQTDRTMLKNEALSKK